MGAGSKTATFSVTSLVSRSFELLNPRWPRKEANSLHADDCDLIGNTAI